jgi:hypothetical protein
LGVEHGLDGRVAVEVAGQGLEHGVVGAADQLAVVGRDAVKGAVAEPDGAVGVVVGFVAAVGQGLVEGGKDLVGVAAGRGVAGRLGGELGAQGGGGAVEGGLGGAGGVGLDGAGEQLGQGGVVAGGEAEFELAGGADVVLGRAAGAWPSAVAASLVAGLEQAVVDEVNERLEAVGAAGVYAAGDVAAAWHPRYQAHVRVEHWANALNQGPAAARNMLGAPGAYERLPYFYSDQYDLGMEYAGLATDWDRVVVRGDLAAREFIAFWLKDQRVVAAMNANVWDVVEPIQQLIRGGRPVDPARLANPNIPFDQRLAHQP